MYFAHCYPYTYTDLQNYLTDIAQDPYRYGSFDVILDHSHDFSA